MTGYYNKILLNYNAQVHHANCTAAYLRELGANGEINTNSDAWLTGVTTTAEEAASFMNHINTNFGAIWVVTPGSASNELFIEQTSIAEITEWPSDDFVNIESEPIVEPQLASPLTPKKLCVGIIKNVDETNHTAIFEDIIVLNKVSSPNVVAVLTEAQTKVGADHGLTFMKLIAVPTNGGLVRAITTSELSTESSNSNWTLSCMQNVLYFFIKPHANSNKFYCLKRGLS